MPRGTRHTLTGTLRLTRLGFELEMDDGGAWRLDIGRKARRYIDQASICLMSSAFHRSTRRLFPNQSGVESCASSRDDRARYLWFDPLWF
jgi:hypothetical protein